MRFFAVFTPLLTAFATLAAAAGSTSNPIMYPYSSTTLRAGERMTIKWQPTTQGTVSLQLRNGPYNNLDKGIAIVSGIPNSGAFTWMIPSTTKYSAYYTIQITSDADQEINYSSPFAIQSSGMASSLSQASMSIGATPTHFVSKTARPEPKVTKKPKAKPTTSKVKILSTSATDATESMSTGAAQMIEVRGGLAAVFALAGVVFIL